ncbi:SAV_915 family protein [Kitasatospora sp. NPDC048194]|uniref:SAV_915 family protein n=1 Tax=Kitasatospora sp. NPDC048194 TaxID=3364045 RepID=UPI0037244240
MARLVWHVPVTANANANATVTAHATADTPGAGTDTGADTDTDTLTGCRTGSGGISALRLFRLRDGRRCAVGFSSPEALAALLGPDHDYVEMGEPALRSLTTPLGVHTLVLDPRLVAPPVAAPVAAPAPAPTAQLQHR